MKKYEYLGKFNGSDLDLIMWNNKMILLDGWNGEKYTECEECIDEFSINIKVETFTMIPIYNLDLEQEQDYIDDLDIEIIDYKRGI